MTNEVYLTNNKSFNAPLLFDHKVNQLLTKLCIEATRNQQMYAQGELSIGNHHLVYGATQYTRDLSGIYCEECLDATKNALLTKSHGKRGGSAFYGSCHIRFELCRFIFYN